MNICHATSTPNCFLTIKSTIDIPVLSVPLFPMLVVSQIVGALLMHFELTSVNAICSPLRPGTTLTPLDEHVSFERTAPWWIPENAKPHMNLLKRGPQFMDQLWSQACGGREKMTAQWSDGTLKILSSGGETLLEESKVTAAVIHPDNIKFVLARGKVQIVKTPWAD